MKQSTILWLTLSLFGAFLLGTYSARKPPEGILKYEVPSDVIKTVAHIHVTDPNYEQIFCDATNDVAYYRYIGERDLLKQDDSVFLYDGTEGVITSTSYNGFTVKLDCPVVQGLSGMAMLDSEGNQVGYISQLLKSGDVFCIWS